jgi:3-ketosteroid 9alpha-monooxygenase subunit A
MMDKFSALFPNLPKGWYTVAYSSELSQGQVIPLKYFDQDLVLYRASSGEPFVLNAYCPHLGAHLGYGGAVAGDAIQCPFHGWRFNGRGQCVDIPYCEGPIPRAKVKSWPVRELGGLIVVHFDPEEGAPAWEPTELPSVAPAEWNLLGQRRMRVQTNNQDVVENFVDAAHFGFLHGLRLKAVSMEDEGPVLRVQYRADVKAGAEGLSYVPVSTNITCFGLGITVTTPKIMDKMEMQVLTSLTPIDLEHVDVRMMFRWRRPTQHPESVVKAMAETAMMDLNKQLDHDIRIWEKKRYVARPILCQGDGPILKFRQWARRFYTQPAAK